MADAAVEHAADVKTDVPGTDRADTSAKPDTATPETHEAGSDLVADHTDAHDGDTGMGGTGTGGTGMGGNGAGGANAGSGGVTTGAGGATPDAAPDAAGGSSGAVGGADGGIDVPLDVSPDVPVDGQPSSDVPTDTSLACGTGCPANVEPQLLLLWVSADVGVTCDQSTPPRLTGWHDRRAGSTLNLTPMDHEPGPQCAGMTLSGIPLPYFDRPTADINSGILPIDLTPLDNSDYTVFVVERRRIADAQYVLGTDAPSDVTLDCVNSGFDNPNAHVAYRFGYRNMGIFNSGSYTFDPDEGSCLDPSFLLPTFSTPQAVLEVELFSSGNTHSLTIGGVTHSSDDVDPMHNLMQGYLGRAFQLPLTSDSRYDGEVAEVVIYKAALSSDEVTAVSNYLTTRWNL